MEFNQFKKELINRAMTKGFSDCEVFYSGGDSFQVTVLNGEIDNYKVSSQEGISFRGVFNGNMGYAYSENTDIEAIDFILKSAQENSEILISDEKEELFAGEKEYAKTKGFNKEIQSISEEEYIQTAKALEKAAKEYDPRIDSVDYCLMAYGEGSCAIATRKGLDVSDKENDITGYVSVIAKDGDSIKTGGEYWIGSNWSEFDPQKVGQKAAENALSHLNAKSVKSGTYKAVFSNEVMSDLLSTFAGIFYADNINKGFSLLKDKIGTLVASPAVCINDDGLLEGGFGTSSFDGEGVACKNKTVIKNGVLETYIHNLKTAKKANVAPTGNGFRQGFKGSVQTACTNFYIVNGVKSCDEIFGEVGTGVYITELAGLHSGANAISGDFSLSAEGFMIENGIISYPVEQITIAGNFYDVLKDIVDTGNDLRFGMPSGRGAFGSPMVVVEKISVSGE